MRTAFTANSAKEDILRFSLILAILLIFRDDWMLGGWLRAVLTPLTIMGGELCKQKSGGICKNNFTLRAITRLSFELRSSCSVNLHRDDEILLIWASRAPNTDPPTHQKHRRQHRTYLPYRAGSGGREPPEGSSPTPRGRLARQRCARRTLSKLQNLVLLLLRDIY